MNDTLAAALLGLIQGLTEFLPVSSTAHLALAQRAFQLDPLRFGLTFDVALHLGTLLAVLLYFLSTWIALVRGLFQGQWKLPLLLVLGTIPGAVIGVLFESVVERELRDPAIIAIALIAGSLIFIGAERFATQRRGEGELGYGDALFIGAAQAIALIPGISRSGITISGGLVRGIERAEATRFAFLIATPIIGGAAAKTLLDLRRATALFERPDLVAIGFGVSFLAGLGTVVFLMRFVRRHSLLWFVPYRVALAVLVLVAVALKAL
ncbi:MAG: undecaprenyl-diphosphate phosphatase [Chloroflexi bacterium]|nr:undecaprenyl-diphosphate phosphatase [Chloroflexota bacterium]